MQLLPEFDLLLVKTQEIMPSRILDGGMEWRETLDKDLPLDIPPPRPAADLGEQLESPLAGPKIGLMETQVGMHDAHQRDIGKMQSLGDHLGAHQDIDLARAKVGENTAIILLPLQGVGIHALDACVREPLAQRILDPLSANARKPDGRIAATRGRTMLGHWIFMAADVAEQPPRGPMIRQGNRTIGAPGHMTALRALQ